MKRLSDKCKIAVIQAAPILFDKYACVEKAIDLIQKSAGGNAELIVFPELFIPGYPYGMTFGFTVGSRNSDGRRDWKMYYDNSIVVPGPETTRIGQAAKRPMLMSASEFPNAMLLQLHFITPIYFSHRRKLRPSTGS